MKTSKNGLKFITQWEGTFLRAYRDVAGVLTIGVGHTSAAGPPTVRKGMAITQDQSNEILARDLKAVENAVNRLVKVPLTQNQFDVLVSFHFNTGALGRSSALRYLNQGNYEQAAINLTLYNKATVNGKKTTIKGLVNRRAAEKKLFLTPDTKSNAGSITTGTVTGGTVVAATSPEFLWPWILAGTAIAAIVIYIGVSIYEFNQHKKDIIDVANSKQLR